MASTSQPRELNPKPTGIYVHFPYCDIKCVYCDFYSIAKRNVRDDLYKDYISHLKQDLLKKRYYIPEKTQIKSIFLGGGTPSKVSPEHIKDLIVFLYENLDIKKNAELTLEANPESLTPQKITGYLQAGINRIHVGIQSRSPRLLKYMGRIYKKKSYLNVFLYLKNAGLQNYGGDMIYGIPSQKIKDLREDIDWLISEGVSHISAYCLTVERNTNLEEQIKKKIKLKPSERRQSFHYDFIVDYLKKKDFIRYEISNFSKKKRHSQHNVIYWKYMPYIGLGVSSHSFLPPFRMISPKNIDSYLNDNYFTVERSRKFPELFIGVFRLTLFQNFSFFGQYLNRIELLKFQELLRRFEKKGWLELFPSGFCITQEGSKYSDTMIEETAIYFT